MELTHIFAADIVKSERDVNGDLLVYGRASNGTIDIDKQIADPEWLKTAMPAWQVWGNVREQHSKVAAGIGLELEDKGGDWWLKSAVIDEGTAKKVERGVLKGYSIGIKAPRIVKDAAAPGGRIVGGEIVEISLVDRPANPDCTITLAKSAGSGADFEASDIEKATDDKVNCPTCDGDGKIMAGKRDCPDCDATGKVTAAKAAELKKDAEPEITKVNGMDGVYELVEGTLTKRDYTDSERADLAKKGHAIPVKNDQGEIVSGAYPIDNVGDLKNAVTAVGRAKDPGATKAFIKRRADELKKPELAAGLKTAETELDKAISEAEKAAEPGQWTHDPELLTTVRDGLAKLLQAELDELMSGERELWDVQDLLTCLQTFMCWWSNEAANGEDPVPYPGQGQGDAMTFIGLGVDADLVKAASADDATQEKKDELSKAVQKALGVDSDSLGTKIAAVLPDAVKGLLEERDNALEERIARVEGAAAPGGPVTTRTNADTAKASEADHLRAEAAKYRQVADQVDLATASGYRQKAAECEAAAAKLAS